MDAMYIYFVLFGVTQWSHHVMAVSCFFVRVSTCVYSVCSNDAPQNAEVSRIVETLVNAPGFGTRCMPGDPIPYV